MMHKAKHAAPRTRAPFWAIVAGTAAAAAIATGTLGWATTSSVTDAPTATAPQTVQEDEPGWDCHTMGNRVCGSQELGEETTIDGRPWVVTVSGLEPVSAN